MSIIIGSIVLCRNITYEKNLSIFYWSVINLDKILITYAIVMLNQIFLFNRITDINLLRIWRNNLSIRTKWQPLFNPYYNHGKNIPHNKPKITNFLLFYPFHVELIKKKLLFFQYWKGEMVFNENFKVSIIFMIVVS